VFFKSIKQRLCIKKFYGRSENAVKSQIWIAVSVYVLVAIVKTRLNLDASLLHVTYPAYGVARHAKRRGRSSPSSCPAWLCPRSGFDPGG
jgi:hypothetical protein